MKQLFQLSREELNTAAERYFLHICGLHKPEASKQHMRESAYAVRDKLAGQLNARAVTRAFSSEVIQENGLHIEGRIFPCRDLALLDKRRVLAVYAYVLTAGELLSSEQDMLETLYCDLWGTAYINAANFALRARLSRNHEQPVYISEAIAPGYYDMGSEKVADLMQIIDGAEIGVALHGMMMTPLKSCAGFYLAVEDKAQVNFLDKRCLYCHKESGGCAFCAYHYPTGNVQA